MSHGEEDTTDSDEVCEVDDDDAVRDSEEGEEDNADSDEVWEDDMDVMHEYSEDEAPSLPEEAETPTESSQNSLISWFTRFILLLQSKHHISDAAIDLLLKFMRVFFLVLSRFSPFIAPIARNIPHSMYMLDRSQKSWLKSTLCVQVVINCINVKIA